MSTDSIKFLESDFRLDSLTKAQLRNILGQYKIPYPSDAMKDTLVNVLKDNIGKISSKVNQEALENEQDEMSSSSGSSSTSDSESGSDDNTKDVSDDGSDSRRGYRSQDHKHESGIDNMSTPVAPITKSFRLRSGKCVAPLESRSPYEVASMSLQGRGSKSHNKSPSQRKEGDLQYSRLQDPRGPPKDSNSRLQSNSKIPSGIAKDRKRKIEEQSEGRLHTNGSRPGRLLHGNSKCPLRERSDRSTATRASPWIVTMLTLVAGAAMFWRYQMIHTGYCDVGEVFISFFKDIQDPGWTSFIRPQCFDRPEDATCFLNLETGCLRGSVLNESFLTFHCRVPLPPAGDPEPQGAYKIRALTDYAIENKLRVCNAESGCSELPSASTSESELKATVAERTRRMSDEEFEGLWLPVMGEIIEREDVVVEFDE